MAHNWELMHIYIKCHERDALRIVITQAMGVNRKCYDWFSSAET